MSPQSNRTAASTSRIRYPRFDSQDPLGAARARARDDPRRLRDACRQGAALRARGAALIPLAWLIGEATEHAAEHTGAGIGGFLNASFGNAPELIIALFAIHSGLPQVVRGSLAGSVISNLLLVFGVAQLVGPDNAPIDRRSLLTQFGLCGAAVLITLPAIVLGYTGYPSGIPPSSSRFRSPSCCSRSISS